jgi:hypothetical protein
VLRISVAAAVFVIALTSTGSAQGSDIPLFNAHDGSISASAGWRSADSQVSFTARQFATTNLNQGEGPPHQKHFDMFMCIEQPGRTICSRNATLSDDDFQVDGNLDTAVINAVVPAEECSGVPITCTDINLHIDLTWTASGPLDHSTRWHNKWGTSTKDCQINEVGSLVWRQAEVQGSISDGTRQFIAGLDTVYASISKSRSALTGRGDSFCL